MLLLLLLLSLLFDQLGRKWVVLLAGCWLHFFVLDLSCFVVVVVVVVVVVQLSLSLLLLYYIATALVAALGSVQSCCCPEVTGQNSHFCSARSFVR